MVRMIEVSRNVGAEQKIMTTSSSMDEKVINNVGKV
jgi:flagellar basal body rod protein FlgG